MENNTETTEERKPDNGKTKEWIYGALAEVSFYAFLYYTQYLLGVRGSLWLSSIILLALLNLSIGLCPLLRKCLK